MPSGILIIDRNGLQCCDAPVAYGPASLPAIVGHGRRTGRTKVGMNTKLHSVTEAKRLLRLLMAAGQVSDTGARAPLRNLSGEGWLLAHRSHDADWFGRLRDWNRIATRYDKRPKVSLSAVASPDASACGSRATSSDVYPFLPAQIRQRSVNQRWLRAPWRWAAALGC